MPNQAWKRETIYTHPTDPRLTVKQVTWRKPGFNDLDNKGWAVLFEGVQTGPAYRTAELAMSNVTIPDRAKNS